MKSKLLMMMTKTTIAMTKSCATTTAQAAYGMRA